jgi:hypothetical protein
MAPRRRHRDSRDRGPPSAAPVPDDHGARASRAPLSASAGSRLVTAVIRTAHGQRKATPRQPLQRPTTAGCEWVDTPRHGSLLLACDERASRRRVDPRPQWTNCGSYGGDMRDACSSSNAAGKSGRWSTIANLRERSSRRLSRSDSRVVRSERRTPRCRDASLRTGGGASYRRAAPGRSHCGNPAPGDPASRAAPVVSPGSGKRRIGARWRSTVSSWSSLSWPLWQRRGPERDRAAPRQVCGHGRRGLRSERTEYRA